MDIRPIRNEDDYKWALQRIEELFDSLPNTVESDTLDIIVSLVDAYEKEAFPIPLPDPIEAIKFRMDAMNLGSRDLEPYIGTRARVWEIMNRRRPLTLRMIRSLEEGLGIPAEVLIQDYELESPGSDELGIEAWASLLVESSSYYDHFADQIQTKLSSLIKSTIQHSHEENKCYWSAIINTFMSSTLADSIGDSLSSVSEKSSSLSYKTGDTQGWQSLRESCPERYWTTDSLEVHTQEEVLE